MLPLQLAPALWDPGAPCVRPAGLPPSLALHHRAKDRCLVLAGTQSGKELVRYPRWADGHGAQGAPRVGKMHNQPSSFLSHSNPGAEDTAGVTAPPLEVLPHPGTLCPSGSLIPSPTFFFPLFSLSSLLFPSLSLPPCHASFSPSLLFSPPFQALCL